MIRVAELREYRRTLIPVAVTGALAVPQEAGT